MMDYSICDLNNLIFSLAGILLQYDDALSEIVQNYDSMVLQVQESLDESRDYWNRFADNERLSSGEQAGIVIESIEALLDEMKVILSELERIDKSFSKYYSKHKEDSCLLSDNLNESTDYLAITRRLSDKLKLNANECSRTLKSYPFQKIEMAFSGKRKEKYSDLINCFLQAEQIADIACEVLPRKTSDYWNAVAVGRDEEIAKAEHESAELIVAIQNEKQEEIEKVLSLLCDDLDKTFPNDFVQQLSDYISSGKVDNRECISFFSPHLPIGYYAHDFNSFVHNGVILSTVKEKLERIMSDTTIVLPAVFDSTKGNNFSIKSNSVGYESFAKKFIMSIMFACLANVPTGCQRFTLMDPEGRTSGFRPMLDFISNNPEVMGEKIITTKEQMQKNLSSLCEHIDSVAQNQFVGYSNIFEYNQKVKDKPEAYRTLVVMDFPKYFDEQMLDSLWNIVNNGNPFGVGVIIQVNDEFKEQRASDRYYSLLDRIEKKLISFEEFSGIWMCNNNVSLLPCDFEEDDFMEFSKSFNEKYALGKKKGLLIDRVVDISNIGNGNSSECLSIPFAIDETGGIKSLEFGDPIASGLSHYALLTGSTGSGKSTLLHTLVMSAIIKYPPEELNIYLMDFKEGTEFKIYGVKQVPHIKLLSTDTMQEFGQSILSELCSEMTRRAKLFKEVSQNTGSDIKNISKYREVTGERMPRILTILDEFQILFDSDANRKVANSCGRMVANLISLARVYGIHFIFSTQTLDRIYHGSYTIRKATLNEMHVRIGLKGKESEADLLFGDANGRIAFSKYGEEYGLGAYVDDDTTGVPTGFKCAYCPEELQRNLLEQIADLYSYDATGTRVFSGNYVPQFEESSEYKTIDMSKPFILLGEPIMIGTDLKISFSNRKRTNLLIVGSNADTMTNLIDLSIRSFKRFFSNDSELFYLDGEKITGGEIPSSSANIISSAGNIHVIDSETATLSALDKIYDWYLNQKHEGARNGNQRIILTIKNLQWIDSINRVLLGKNVDEYKIATKGARTQVGDHEDLFSFIPKENNPNDLSNLFDDFNSEVLSQQNPTIRPNYRTMLLELIEFGYMYGVNIIMTASDFTAVKEYMYDILPKFSERIIFELNDTDADRIIPEAKIQDLPENILLYSNSVNSTFQFKPFLFSEES